MGNLPYVAFYPGKWLGRTARLSALERGVFITLICEMYETMAPLKLEHKALARLCGTTPKTLEKALAVLLDDPNKLVMSEGGLWNHRVEKEIKKAQKTSEISRQNSQKRWEKRKKNNDGAMPSHSNCNPIQNQNHNKEVSNDTSKARKRAVRLSKDWQLPDDWLSEAVEAGLTRQQAEYEAAQMHDWSLSSPKGAKLDWHATWRSWFRRRLNDQTAPRGQSPPQPSRHVQRLQTANDWINDGNESETGDSGDAERLGAAQGRRHGSPEHLRLIAGDQKQ